MHCSDDALAIRERSDEATVRKLEHDLGRPISFPRPTTIEVLTEYTAEPVTVACELWVDRNIAMRDAGIDLRRDRYASAYWDWEKCMYVISGNDRDVVERLRQHLSA